MDKTFNVNDYDVIGFDWDFSLLRYNLMHFAVATYELMIEYLENERNYPKGFIKMTIEVALDFMQKGLAMDLINGNILKLGEDFVIIKATHGTKELQEEQIKEIYGNEKKWSTAKEFFENPIDCWEGKLTNKIKVALDYFEICIPSVFGQVVDFKDSQPSNKINDYFEVWQDVLGGIHYAYHKRHSISLETRISKIIEEDKGKFLFKVDERTKEKIANLRENGILTFLLAGSDIDFVNMCASYALGENWTKYFDYVLAYARKPDFFTGERPFFNVENFKSLDTTVPLTKTLEVNHCYCAGNWKQFTETIKEKLGNRENIRYLYYGDNILRDIFCGNKFGMDCITICEELLGNDIKSENPKTYEFRPVIFSEFWGPSFPTLWSFMVEKYSKCSMPILQV